jgi:hypothetical protein
MTTQPYSSPTAFKNALHVYSEAWKVLQAATEEVHKVSLHSNLPAILGDTVIMGKRRTYSFSQMWMPSNC